MGLFALIPKFTLAIFPEVEAGIRVVRVPAVVSTTILFHEVPADSSGLRSL
jgi:hypothetical protein